MLFRATALKRSHLALILTVLGSCAAFGQAPDSPIIFAKRDAITVSLVDAPAIGGSNNSSSSGDTKWLKVELHYGVTTKDGTPPFLDAADFKVWIEGRDLYDPLGKPDEGLAVVLTGTVTYVNIPASKDAYAVFYVHPSTLSRYCTRLGTSDFLRKFDVHAEIFVGGDKMDYMDKNNGETSRDWFKAPRAVAGLVYRQDQCPFLVSDPNRYPAIKLPAPAGQ